MNIRWIIPSKNGFDKKKTERCIRFCRIYHSCSSNYTIHSRQSGRKKTRKLRLDTVVIEWPKAIVRQSPQINPYITSLHGRKKTSAKSSAFHIFLYILNGNVSASIDSEQKYSPIFHYLCHFSWDRKGGRRKEVRNPFFFSLAPLEQTHLVIRISRQLPQFYSSDFCLCA